MSKLDRRNQARQKQRLKHKGKSEATTIFSGQNGASRHVAVIPLSDKVDPRSAIRLLDESVDIPYESSQGGIIRVRMDRFKQNIMYIPTSRDLIRALDACRLADVVILVLPAEAELSDVDNLLLRSIEGQGISNVLAVVQVCPSVA
jgi:pre-rRNA-processing protein TSR1